MKSEIEIDGASYVLKSEATPAIAGKRAVVVVDRGWIFAGDVTEEDGRIRLSRAVHVFRWETIGFARVVAMSAEDKEKITLHKCGDVDLPSGAEIFRCPVGDDWGL